MSTVTVPARLVNVMREVLVEERLRTARKRSRTPATVTRTSGSTRKSLKTSRSAGSYWNRSGRYAPPRRSRSS